MRLSSTDCQSSGRIYCTYGYGRLKYRDVNTCLQDKKSQCLSEIAQDYYQAPTQSQQISCAKKVGQSVCRAGIDLPKCKGQVHTKDNRKSDLDYRYCLTNRQWDTKTAGTSIINPVFLLVLGGGLYYAYKQGWFNKKIGLKV